MKLVRLTTGLIFITLAACAQTPRVPTPPPTPNTPGSSHTEVVTSSSSRVNSSTSVSDANSSYKFRSKFHSSKRKGIENILVKALDGIEMKKRNNRLEWEILQEGEILFECSLTQNRLSIYVNKELSTGKFNTIIKQLGEDLQDYISSYKSRKYVSRSASLISRAEERLERAKLEMEQSIKNLEEVRRENEQ